MGKLDEFVLKDKISAKLCEKACADLKTLGLSARIVKEYRAEEKVGLNLDEVAKGHLIQIGNSPISWINIIWRWPFGSVMVSSVSQESPFIFAYLIANPSLKYSKRKYAALKPFRSRSLPLIGTVSGIQWKGVYADDIIQTLKTDIIISQFLITDWPRIKIFCYPDDGYWSITEEGQSWPKLSRGKWECYKRIAKYLQ